MKEIKKIKLTTPLISYFFCLMGIFEIICSIGVMLDDIATGIFFIFFSIICFIGGVILSKLNYCKIVLIGGELLCFELSAVGSKFNNIGRLDHSNIIEIKKESNDCVKIFYEKGKITLKEKGIAEIVLPAYEKRTQVLAEEEKKMKKRIATFSSNDYRLGKYLKYHYKIDIDKFALEASKKYLVCTKNISDLNNRTKYWEYSDYYHMWFTTNYIVLFPNLESGEIAKNLFSGEINKEFIKALDHYGYSVENFEKKLVKSSELLYVEYIEDIYNMDFSYSNKKPSKMDLALTEELFGTAAAINKVIDANTQKIVRINRQYYKFVFKNDIFYMPKSIDTNKVAYNLSLEKSKDKYEKALINNKKSSSSPLDEIKKAKKLYDEGILTEEEFNKIKKKLIDK